MTTITKERIELFVKSPLENGLTRGEQMELARIALASLDAETVRYLNKFSGTCVTLEQQPNAADDVAVYIPLYAAPPVLEREQIRREHAEWSDKTFGNVGPVGPLKHLSKEALEAAADPSDPLEWADMQFLLWDAQRRMGLSDEFITRAMIEKLEINKSRQWPEPKDGEPRLHIKEQPVLVVPEEIEPDSNNTYDYVDGWNACRAAMLQSKYRDLSQPVDPQISEYEKIMLRAGWVMVPVEPTDEMIEAAINCEDVTYNESDDTVFYVHHREIYKAMLAAAPQH
ncbi:DUF550 domain-containing protein [Salmonella enterica]